MSDSTRLRDKAIALAKRDVANARHIAESIPEPWFRTQALAVVAFHTADNREFSRILKESYEASDSCSDPFQKVGVAAWPLSAQVNRGFVSDIQARVSELIVKSRTIPNDSSRSEAMFHVLQAVFPLGPDVFDPILGELSDAHKSRAGLSWRTCRNLRDTILFLGPKYPAIAKRVLNEMVEGPYRRQAEQQLRSDHHSSPRNFME